MFVVTLLTFLFCQDILRLGADHLLLLLGALPGHLSPHLPVHHGGHREDHEVGVSVRPAEKFVKIVIFAFLPIVAKVLLIKPPTHYQIEPIKVFSMSTYRDTPVLLQPLLTDLTWRA